jgi:type I restriction-modification system DNA methylase subunit
MTYNFQEKANFIWQVADNILRGTFKAHEYGNVILPFVILRRLGLVLEPKKDAVIKQFKQFKASLDEERMIPVPKQAAGGINLTEDDKVDMQHIRTCLEADEGLRDVFQADNPRDAKVYKFNQVLDRLLLEFIHTKLDLYKKLTEPKVNEMLKRQWFEVLASEMG